MTFIIIMLFVVLVFLGGMNGGFVGALTGLFCAVVLTIFITVAWTVNSAYDCSAVRDYDEYIEECT